MTKIEKLTPAQMDAARQCHARALEIGTSTEPADRPRAEAAITRMYELIDEAPPTFVWCQSPATALLCLEVLHSSLESSVRSSVWSSLESSVRSSLDSSLWSSVESSLGSFLHSSLWSSLELSLWSSLGSALASSLDSSLGSSLWSSFWGQHEVSWSAFYSFCASELGVTYDAAGSEKLGLWQSIAESCGWWYPYRGLVVACERPTAVHMEPTGTVDGWLGTGTYRLHNDTGPALAFGDGWSVWAINGVRVPQAVVESPETITPEMILAESNAEVRRVMIERGPGWNAFAAQAGTLIDECPDPANGPHTIRLYELPEALRKGVGDVRLIVVTNGTPEPDGHHRQFGLTVDREHNTALAAAASTYGLSAGEYARLERRT